MRTKEELEVEKLSEEIAKIKLEGTKLKEEINEKQRFFFAKPEWWTSNILAVVAVCGLIINIIMSNAAVDRVNAAKERAEVAKDKAEISRDKAEIDLKQAQHELKLTQDKLEKTSKELQQIERDLSAFQTTTGVAVNIRAIVLDEEGKPIFPYKYGLVTNRGEISSIRTATNDVDGLQSLPGEKVAEFYVEANGYQRYVIRPVRGFLPSSVTVKLKKAPGTQYFKPASVANPSK